MQKVNVEDILKYKAVPVLINLGMEEKIFNGKHQPCLYCGGKDRARWVKKDNYYICNQCGYHSAIDIAMEYLQKDFIGTAKEIKKNIGISMNDLEDYEIKKKADDIKLQRINEDRLKRIHSGLKKITFENEASIYLKNRGISTLPENNCFYHPGVPYYNNGELKGTFEAMVSRFENNNKIVTYHVTYLKDGEKLKCKTPRKILPTVSDMPGGCVKLFECNEILGIAEGIESALSAHEMDGYPVWATLNSEMMKCIVIPDTVKKLVIYADSDKSFTGQLAAFTLANRYALKGVDVYVNMLIKDQSGNIISHVERGLDRDVNDV